jgi:outer membrane protein with beta-barrel domain
MAPRATAVVIVGLLAALPASASAASLQLRIGGFLPRADSNLFDDDNELYTVDKEDWRGVTGGAEFTFEPSDHVEFGLHLDGYSRTVDTNYRNYTRPSGQEILQSLRLTLVPLGATVRLLPTDRYATLQPYVGVGPDLVFYEYEEFGDFIDFGSEELDIVSDHFRSRGAAPGFHVTGGVRVRLGHDFSVLGEARYQWAKRELGDDFRQQPGQDALRLDMSGLSAVVGLSIRF